MAIEKKKNNNVKKNVVWTSKRVDEWMKDYAEGIIHKSSPWADGVIGVRNPDIVFEYTQDEISELSKCANDIIYFANNYCYCMQGSSGYKPITLRDYQEEMLKSYVENRFSITLASRQVGKCHFGDKIEIQQMKNKFHKYIEDVYYDRKKGFLSSLKHFLIKIYRKL